MSSLIPALSEKARLEIRKKVYENDEDIEFELTPRDCERAFQDLFDLEKYPITWEQLFDFCENHPCMNKNQFYAHGTEFIYRKDGADGFLIIGSIHFNYYPPYAPKKLFEGTIIDTLNRIAKVTEMDLIIIIGDIHGWWEKPRTY